MKYDEFIKDKAQFRGGRGIAAGDLPKFLLDR
jgi:hypothetical protein